MELDVISFLSSSFFFGFENINKITKGNAAAAKLIICSNTCMQLLFIYMVVQPIYLVYFKTPSRLVRLQHLIYATLTPVIIVPNKVVIVCTDVLGFLPPTVLSCIYYMQLCTVLRHMNNMQSQQRQQELKDQH